VAVVNSVQNFRDGQALLRVDRSATPDLFEIRPNIGGNRSKTAGNMARYAFFVALCLLFAQTWQRWRTIWARCGTGWAPLMFNLSPR